MNHNLKNFGVLQRISNLLMENESLMQSFQQFKTIGSGMWFNEKTGHVECQLYIPFEHEEIKPPDPVIGWH